MSSVEEVFRLNRDIEGEVHVDIWNVDRRVPSKQVEDCSERERKVMEKGKQRCKACEWGHCLGLG